MWLRKQLALVACLSTCLAPQLVFADDETPPEDLSPPTDDAIVSPGDETLSSPLMDDLLTALGEDPTDSQQDSGDDTEETAAESTDTPAPAPAPNCSSLLGSISSTLDAYCEMGAMGIYAACEAAVNALDEFPGFLVTDAICQDQCGQLPAWPRLLRRVCYDKCPGKVKEKALEACTKQYNNFYSSCLGLSSCLGNTQNTDGGTAEAPAPQPSPSDDAPGVGPANPGGEEPAAPDQPNNDPDPSSES